MRLRLEHTALRWLAWEKKCLAVMHERTPRYARHAVGVPDVLGITRSRYLIEIEIKRTMQDFRANGNKPHVQNREMWVRQQPKQFYFHVPELIADKCLAELPPWAGLMMLVDNCNVVVVRLAPVNPESKRLSVRECVRMFHLMSNQIVSQSSSLDGYLSRWEHAHDPYYWSYEI